MDAVMDRARGTLIVNALYAEPHSPNGTSTQSAIADAIEDLSKFLGAHQIEHRKNAPREWRHVLR
jgi:uncharacterized protein YcaQ